MALSFGRLELGDRSRPADHRDGHDLQARAAGLRRLDGELVADGSRAAAEDRAAGAVEADGSVDRTEPGRGAEAAVRKGRRGARARVRGNPSERLRQSRAVSARASSRSEDDILGERSRGEKDVRRRRRVGRVEGGEVEVERKVDQAPPAVADRIDDEDARRSAAEGLRARPPHALDQISGRGDEVPAVLQPAEGGDRERPQNADDRHRNDQLEKRESAWRTSGHGVTVSKKDALLQRIGNRAGSHAPTRPGTRYFLRNPLPSRCGIKASTEGNSGLSVVDAREGGRYVTHSARKKIIFFLARGAELADAPALGAGGETRAGSSPASRTIRAKDARGPVSRRGSQSGRQEGLGYARPRPCEGRAGYCVYFCFPDREAEGVPAGSRAAPPGRALLRRRREEGCGAEAGDRLDPP